MAVIRSKPIAIEPASTKRCVGPHERVVLKGASWLRAKGCGVVITDKHRAITSNGEVPDVIGWRDVLSIVVECKTSRSDFHEDFKKPFRHKPNEGMGDWRFILCPDGLIRPEELLDGWGLLYLRGRSVIDVYHAPSNTQWLSQQPFKGNKRAETDVLTGMLRRYQNNFGRI